MRAELQVLEDTKPWILTNLPSRKVPSIVNGLSSSNTEWIGPLKGIRLA